MNDSRKSGQRPALGLSVGSNTLAAVSADRSVTRRTAVRVNGSWITDFVERVGDPVGIIAADGSSHCPEVLLAGELRSLARDVTGGERMPPNVAIAYPAHWHASAVEALRRVLQRSPDWPVEPMLIPDNLCALAAVDVPANGVAMLCDFGGGGTTISFNAADKTLIGGPARHLDFSGERIDRAVLAFVLGNLSCNSWPGLSGTLAFGPLIRLRDECRAVKERLSHETATVVSARETRVTGGIRFTRAEFDDIIDPMLADLIDVVRGTMVRAGVRSNELTAIATVGGGAAIPVITTALSEHLRVPVVTPPRPALSAAIGAALRAGRASTPLQISPPMDESIPAERVGRAWSAAPDVPRLRAGEPRAVRPQITFEPADVPDVVDASAWYRRPMPVVLATLLVIVGAGLATVVGLRSNSTATSTTPPVPPTVVAIPATDAPPVAEAAPAAPAEDPQPLIRTVVEAPPVTRIQVVQAPPIVETQVVEAPPVAETPVAQARLVQAPIPVQLPAIPAIPPIPTALPIPAIPGLQLVLPGVQPSG